MTELPRTAKAEPSRGSGGELRGCALHFDCFAGIAGDMTLGALIDLGVPEDVILAELARLPVAGYRLWHERVQRGALMGTHVHVDIDEPTHAHAHDHDHAHHHDQAHHAHPHEHGHEHERHHHEHEHAHEEQHVHHAHRHWRDIRQMLQAGLSGEVRERAMSIFSRIAEVEAHLHGVTVDEVAFHEVGAIDSIVDIVGAAAALAWLSPSQVTSRRVPLGGGRVRTAHGLLPVPAPATLELLAGVPVEAGDDALGELTTPTGAAIVAATASAFGPLPPVEVIGVGWGAGTRELADRPNLLRVVAGRRSLERAAGEVVIVEANVDDMSPELCEPLFEALFAAGALDVWLHNIVMKKGRPAYLVAALCTPERREAVTAALLRESTTLGVRHRVCDRTVLARELVEVDTPYGRIPVKVGRAPSGELVNAAPEYEAARAAARAHQVAVKQVFAAALAEFYRTR